MKKLVLALEDTKQSMIIEDNVRKLKCKKCGSRFKYPERLEKHRNCT